ncbi:MAG: SIR2 family protein [Candidatus Accumulibacter sp.]|uniref:anti-phage defense-associated sirtuin Dsr1 n=1 Tax=Accumulibacter sp. TaxID=2053492 RepID=UPI00258E1EA4|nr:anti-phage defense-associated sirtuin Dsr1 [Accumulibacter sp.]MCM8621413.1 SIR2 family protein [Accumulibacter sp.]
MPQFVRHGPDIPERLLQLHEDGDGRVVFFCGAGISYPARLPDFAGLVKKLYQALSVTPNAVQQATIKARQFDTAIGLLEADVVGGRETVRRAMAAILAPDLTAPNASTTHEALLTLGQNRQGRMRLITTNFDRLFEHAMASKSLSPPTFQAPLLPVPKARWDGLVYLHGLLSATPTPGELDRLVISSGDFGLAYLTERWAARFVSELFRGYTVCFVGYSINDPVLRYMMDALAADRLLGESPPEMFAFGSYSKGKEVERANEWKAKNVTPILYREHRYHAYLHKTLHAWAATYRDGVRGKERIVIECAIGRPLASTKQDDFVGRMLWALSDRGGLPAKRFAELDPVPSLDWLELLSQDLYCHADLGRFGVPGQSAVDEALAFSLTRRPAPSRLAPWMAMADSGNRASNWDDVMRHLACWLTRHLDDPKLLLWLVKHGGQLHHQLIWLIERRLEELGNLERDGEAAKLARIREKAPNAIPRPAMRTLWRLLLSGRVKSRARDRDLYRWREHFKRDGLGASARLALREVLTPYVSLREPFRWTGELEGSDATERIKDIVEWEIELASDHVHFSLRDMPQDERWAAALPDLLNDFSALLRDALDLMRELDGADSRSDHSYWHQPSISEHPQNQGFHDWTALIELTRDAWLATVAQFPEQARIAAEAWAHAPYPVFRRLAFFAAAQGDIVPTRLALDFLLKDDHWWLWSVATQRETIRLLVSLAPRLDAAMLADLEQAILSGPPRTMFREDIEDDDWTERVDRRVWLRLAKMAQAGAALGANSNARLAALTAQYPVWQLAVDERDEFFSWMEGGWVGDRDPGKSFVPVPRTRRGVLDYLLAHPVLEASKQDDWRQRCSESFQAIAYALCKLAQQDNWPVERWRDGLQAWSEENLRDRSWRYMAPVLVSAPDDLIQALKQGVSWWLRSMAKTFQGHDAHFLALARRILQLDFEPEDGTDDPVFHAINHPVGHVTQALLDWWYRQGLEDGQKLTEAIKPVFSKLCDTGVVKFRHGRLLLAAHVITLFRVDGSWAQQYLLPLFDWWRSETEARAAWEGFLWSPRLYRPLMEVLKSAFLETANHYAQLGEHGRQYASLLTFAALDPGDTFTISELASAVRALPSEGLREAAEALTKALEGAGDRREDYWKNRIQPFWERIWPKSNDRAADTQAESLARLCIAAGGEFASAMARVGNWLQTVEHPDHVIRELDESGLCTRFPDDALQLLDAILGDQPSWLPSELRQCLNAIAQAAPNLRQDRRFMRVDELARRFGV